MKQSKKALIIANGNLGDASSLKKKLPESDLVIACDGGIRHLKALELLPDIIVGDFDSAEPALLKSYLDMGIPYKKYPKEKDKTDTHIAVDIALQEGADEIILTGAFGSRFDHSYANVMLLVYLSKMGIKGKIMDSCNTVMVFNKSFELSGTPGRILSLLPLGDNCIIESLSGLAYKVENKSFPVDFPVGVSNVFEGSKASVKLKSGWIMAVMTQD